MSAKRLTVLENPGPGSEGKVPSPKGDDKPVESTRESRTSFSGDREGVRRLSLSKQAPTFKDRRIKFGGDTAVDIEGGGGMDELRMRGIGHVCRRGKKPDSPCQDDFFVVADPNWVFAGVFDGHGPVGHLLANTAQHTVMEHALLDEGDLLAKTPSVL